MSFYVHPNGGRQDSIKLIHSFDLANAIESGGSLISVPDTFGISPNLTVVAGTVGYTANNAEINNESSMIIANTDRLNVVSFPEPPDVITMVSVIEVFEIQSIRPYWQFGGSIGDQTDSLRMDFANYGGSDNRWRFLARKPDDSVDFIEIPENTLNIWVILTTSYNYTTRQMDLWVNDIPITPTIVGQEISKADYFEIGNAAANSIRANVAIFDFYAGKPGNINSVLSNYTSRFGITI